MPGFFAITARVGDVLTGSSHLSSLTGCILEELRARLAAISWNLFGMADLVDAVAIGVTTGKPASYSPWC